MTLCYFQEILPKDNDERKKKKTQETNFPLFIHINFAHNHEINRQDHKRYRNVSQDTKDAFTAMFEDDLTPSAAWEKHRKDIQEKFPDDYHTKFGDRHICPDYFWAFNFYRKWIINTLGSYEGVDAYVKITEFVKEYNDKTTKNNPCDGTDIFAKVAQTEDGETCIAICDPFQRRVHKIIPQAADLLMMDATSNVDRSDTKIFHLMCPSSAGGLPLATLVTTREDAATIKFGLELLKTVLPTYAFYGRGPALGPALGITDDSDSERQALLSAWPQLIHLLCQFHLLQGRHEKMCKCLDSVHNFLFVFANQSNLNCLYNFYCKNIILFSYLLQALWQWLWSGDHKIEKNDRTPLLKLFRELVYSDTDKLFQKAEKDMKKHPLYKKYPAFKKHIEEDVLPRKELWSILYRIKEKLPTSSVNTTNYVESSFRWTKEWQFNRHRAYNLLDLLQVVMDDSQYQARRCIDMANNVLTSRLRNQKSRYLSKKTTIDHTKITRIDETSFLVPSETKKDIFYTVNIALRLCECYMGQLKGPCKHKSIVSETQNIASFDVVPTQNPEMRAVFMYLGTGKKQDPNWFKPLSSANTNQFESTGLLDQIDNFPDVEMEDAHEEHDDHASSDVSNEEKVDELKYKLKQTLAMLEGKICQRIERDIGGYEKALKIFEKHVERLPATTDSALQKSLCSFGETSTPALSVTKRKKGKYINVQATSRSRRAIPLRGSRAAYFGAPTKAQQLKAQLCVTETDEVFGHKLPGMSKKKKKKHPHDLMKSVAAGRAAERKH